MADYDDGLRVVHQNGRVPSPVLGYEAEMKPVESIETITHKVSVVVTSDILFVLFIHIRMVFFVDP